MRHEDSTYYRRRALQEQLAAQRATCLAARRSHEELAQAYRFRAAMLAEPAANWVYALGELEFETV